MPESPTPQQDESIADLQAQLAALEQENIRLHSRLQACERSQASPDPNRSTLEHRLLEATTTAANALLTVKDVHVAVNTALQVIGESLDTDRVTVIENFDHPSDPSFLYWRALYEWDSPNTISQISHPDAAQGSYEGIEELYELCSRGQGISCLLEDLPEPFRSGQAELGVKTLHAVPIFVEGKFWGVVGFDDCREAKRRTTAELSVLKIAANCIGSAIQQQRTQQALLQAEQARSQELERHNAELQQTLDRLTESEHRYRTLFELSNEGIYRFELKQPVPTSLPVEEQLDLMLQRYCFVEANQTFCAQMGLTIDQLREFTLSDFHGDLEANRQVNRSIIANEYRIKNAETDELDALGRHKYFLNNVVCDVKDGYVWGGWCTQTDITELRETQQALLEAEQARSQELERHNAELQQTIAQLAESEERFRTLFELSSEGFYYVEVDPPCPVTLPIEEQFEWLYQNIRVVKANPAFAAMYGVDNPDELIGLKNADVHVPGSEKNAAFIRGFIENGYCCRNLETEEIDPHGRLHYFLNSGVATVRDGYVRGAWATQTDITELRQAQQTLLQAEQVRSQELERYNIELQQTLDRLTESEQRYRQLMELASEGIFRVEYGKPIPIDLPVEEQAKRIYQQFQYAEHNLAFAEMYGYDQADALVGTSLAHIMNAPENAVQMEQFVRNGHQMRNQETVEVDRFGRKRHFLNNGFSIIRDGYAIGGWGTQIDITELREAQQALLQAEQDRVAELEKLNEDLQQRDRLLSIVAAVSKDLLESVEVNSTIAQALEQIGEVAGISRITLMREKPEASSGRLQHHVIQEWTASNVPRQIDDPVTKIVNNDEYGILADELHAGRSVWHALEEFPEPARTQQAGIEVKSTGAVPIFIEGEYFGCVAFDDCVDYRRWSTHEIDVLTSSAGAIGAALHRKQLVDRLIAERIQAEQARSAELAKANEALKRSLDILAADPDLDRFIGHTLKIIADQFDSPLTEYWSHAEQSNIASVTLTCWQGQILKPTDQPGHPGLIGMPIPPKLRHNEALERRQRHALYQGIGSETDEIGKQISAQVGFDVSAWYTSRGVTQFLNIPLNVGDTTIGALAIYLPSECTFPEQTIELAHAFAQQLALAIQLTQLADEAKQAAILDERNRMARDIHDTLAQSFTGIIMQLEAVRGDTSIPPDNLQTRLDRVSDLARLGLSEARRSVQALRPQALEAANFADALRHLLHQMTHDTPIYATLNVEGTAYPLLPTIEENLLRIVQEAVTNAIRHGHARTITLQLLFEPTAIHLQISDDGNGFDPQSNIPAGFGLIGMQERTLHLNGQFHLTSRLGQGTEITVSVPV